jgi:hypothetical protein
MDQGHFRYCSAKTYQIEPFHRRQVEGLIGKFFCHGIYYCPGYISEYQLTDLAEVSYSAAKNTNERKYMLFVKSRCCFYI